MSAQMLHVNLENHLFGILSIFINPLLELICLPELLKVLLVFNPGKHKISSLLFASCFKYISDSLAVFQICHVQVCLLKCHILIGCSAIDGDHVSSKVEYLAYV